MALIAKEGGKGYPIIPADIYQGVCYAVIDLGSHYDERYEKTNHKILIIWEIPELMIEVTKDGNTKQMPRVISKQYTFSLGERANLRKDLESWRGRMFLPQELEGFDLQHILGVNCMLQIIHYSKNNKQSAVISNILPLYKGMKPKEPINKITLYSIHDDDKIPEEIPDWIKEVIKSSDEWKMKNGIVPQKQEEEMPLSEEIPYDDVPF